MTDLIWHDGPPPHVGWWHTQDPSGFPDELRWWDGQHWSVAVGSHYDPDNAEISALPPALFGLSEIQWCDYWPTDARVPRLDPTDGHWTFNTTGERPTDCPRRIQVVFRNGWAPVADSRSSRWRWDLAGDPGDIIAWRPAIDTTVNWLHN